MLIFQPHLSHIITNSWRPLHDLSHLQIIFRKARFPYQHVILKHWPPILLSQTHWNIVACSKIFGTPTLDQSVALMMSSTVKPDIAALVVAAALVECA